MFIDGLNWQ